MKVGCIFGMDLDVAVGLIQEGKYNWIALESGEGFFYLLVPREDGGYLQNYDWHEQLNLRHDNFRVFYERTIRSFLGLISAFQGLGASLPAWRKRIEIKLRQTEADRYQADKVIKEGFSLVFIQKYQIVCTASKMLQRIRIHGEKSAFCVHGELLHGK